MSKMKGHDALAKSILTGKALAFLLPVQFPVAYGANLKYEILTFLISFIEQALNLHVNFCFLVICLVTFKLIMYGSQPH